MVLLRTRSRRRALDAPFPPGLLTRLSRTHPLLDDAALSLVEQGLRQWFAVCQQAEGEHVAMPSVVVDDLWHELIVHTAAYECFCREAFGRFLHHTPEEAMAPQDALANGGPRLRRTYELACALEGGTRGLPLLFRVDRLLRVRHGRTYVEDCGTGPLCQPPAGAACLRHLPPVPGRASRSGRGSTAWGGNGFWSDSGSSGWSWGGGDSAGWGGGDSGGDSGGGGGCGGGGCGGGS